MSILEAWIWPKASLPTKFSFWKTFQGKAQWKSTFSGNPSRATLDFFTIKHRRDFSNTLKINSNFNNVTLVWCFLSCKCYIFTLRPSMLNLNISSFGRNLEQSERGKCSMIDREERTLKIQPRLLKWFSKILWRFYCNHAILIVEIAVKSIYFLD